jgi:hypothetical protein
VPERLLAVQAQDPRGFRLAVRARTTGVSAPDVDRALTEDRSIVVTWLNRGTLHLVRREDFPWLHTLTAPPHLKATARRLGQLGVSDANAKRGVEAVERSLGEEGPLTRDQLAERLARAGLPSEGQAFAHLLGLTCLRGLAVRGPMVDGKHAYALVRDWLGAPGHVDRDSALAELARRYLAGHGPAGERDLARWAGLPLRDVRAGLNAVASELEQRQDGLVALARRRRTARLPPPRLLGAFEPLLLGWIDREPLLGSHKDAITVGGLFLPFVLVEGRAAGTWSMRKGEVTLEPFGHLPKEVAAALEAETAAVKRFFAGG